jgi:hypothetical protein
MADPLRGSRADASAFGEPSTQSAVGARAGLVPRSTVMALGALARAPASSPPTAPNVVSAFRRGPSWSVVVRGGPCVGPVGSLWMCGGGQLFGRSEGWQRVAPSPDLGVQGARKSRRLGRCAPTVCRQQCWSVKRSDGNVATCGENWLLPPRAAADHLKARPRSHEARLG